MMKIMVKLFTRIRQSRSFQSFGLLIFFIALALTVVLQLWNWSPNVPLSMGGDNSFYLMLIENLARGNSIYQNPSLGAPIGQVLYDYPAIGDLLNYGYVRLLSLLTRNAPLAETLFYFSTFFSTAITSFVTCRRINLSRNNSIAVSVLFAFLPYHLIKNVQHLMLGNYMALPLIIYVLLELHSSNNDNHDKKRNKYLIISGVIMAGPGIYYAIFSAITLGILLIGLMVAKKQFKATFKKFVWWFASFVLTLIISAIPTFGYSFQNGFHNFKRTYFEVEFYGLKIANLFRPIVEHRWSWLSNFSKKFSSSPIPGEPVEMLGLIGAIGLTILFLHLLFDRFKSEKQTDEKVNILVIVGALAILLSTVGSLNSIMFAVGLQQIRVWSRIAPLIGFCALVVLFLFLQKGISKFHILQKNKILISMTIMLIGIIDQTSTSYVPNYTANAIRWEREDRFVKAADTYFVESSMILQLPLTEFPENGPVHKMEDYFHAFPFIHGSHLRWSYGNLKTRPSDFHDLAKSKNEINLLRFAKSQGFVGVHIVTSAFEDGAKLFIAQALEAGCRRVYTRSGDVNVLLDLRALR
jgi:phosphoglycerol transferase